MTRPHTIYASDILVIGNLRERYNLRYPFGLTPPQKTALAKNIAPTKRHPHIDDFGRRTYLG